ncbi:hypothetical protein MPH_00336, partial [Macrophomina phaseolina MS6]
LSLVDLPISDLVLEGRYIIFFIEYLL